MNRSKSRFSSAPIAPYKVSLLKQWRTSRLGRTDARNHKGIADATLTQALKGIAAYAQSGQHEVNRWLIKESEPIVVGSSRIRIQLGQLESEILNFTKNLGDSGRERKLNKRALELLIEKKTSQMSQLEMNSDSLEALYRQGTEAIESWERYFTALASIYLRSLSKKLKQDVRSSDAEVPPFDNVPIVDLEQK